MAVYKIADSYMKIEGKVACVPDEFAVFQSNTDGAGAQQVELILQKNVEKKIRNGMLFAKGDPRAKTVISSHYVSIYQRSGEMYLNYHEYDNLFYSILREDGAQVEIYMDQEMFEIDPKTMKSMLNYVLRDAFLYWIQRQGKMALHSATVIYRDKVYAFVGESGAGKTTHTQMWQEMHGSEILDGDVCVIQCTKAGEVVAYGLPWCGTSGIYQNACYPLGGVVLLQQAPKNQVEQLEASEAEMVMICQCMSPNWNKECMNYNLDICDQFMEQKVPVWLLRNRPEPEAVEMIRHRFDHS